MLCLSPFLPPYPDLYIDLYLRLCPVLYLNLDLGLTLLSCLNPYLYLNLYLNLALFPFSFVGRTTDTFLGTSLSSSPSRRLCRSPPELPRGHGRGFSAEWD